MKPIRWTPVVLIAAVLASLAVVIAAPWARPDGVANQSPSPSAIEPSPSGSLPEPTDAPVDRELSATGYVGPAYDINLVSEPTLPTSQARLWFNDGSWWGLLVSERTNRVSIHELDWESQRWVDSGVPVDARSFVGNDVLWDGTTLHVAGAGPRNAASDALQVSSFAYDADSRNYVLERDSPIQLTSTGVEGPTLAASADGEVWVAYVWSRDLYVSHAAGDGGGWAPPFRVPAEDDAEVAAMVATPDGVAVAWTSLERDTLSVARHRGGDADDDWDATSTTVDGLSYGEDEISVGSTADGTILVLLRTSLDRVENRNLDAPQLVLAQLSGEEWRQAVVGRVRDGHEGPSLLVDDARGDVYVLAEAEGRVYAKRARLDDLSFVTGPGVLAIEPPEPSASPSPSPSGSPSPGASPSPEPPVPAMVGATSTRQGLDTLTEIVALAADDATGRYGHAVIMLPDGRSAPDAQGHLGPPPDGVPEGLQAGEVAFVFRDSFGPYDPGPGSRSGWTTRSEPADELVTIAEPSPGDPSLRLSSGAAGDGPRACKPITRTTSGIVVVRATVQVRGTPESDATVTAIRSDGAEIAAVRFGGQGTLRYFVGDERITTAIAYQPGTWYESSVTVDLDSQTYHWQLTPLGASSPILAVEGLTLRGSAPLIDEACVQAANAAAGSAAELYVDDVLVAIGPGE